MKIAFTNKILLSVIVFAVNTSISLAQLTAWKYKDAVSILENSGTAKTNYQVSILLDTKKLVASGKMNANGSDIRFTSDCAGNTLLDYYIEKGINTSNTQIWVKLPALAANTNVTIFMFYGNTAATAVSNFANTFPKSRIITAAVALTKDSVSWDYDWLELKSTAIVNLASTYGGTFKINARKIIIDGQLRGDSAGYAGGVATKGAGTGGGRPGTGTAGAGGGAYGGGGGLAGYCCNDTPARGQGGDAYGTIDADDIDAGSGGAGASSVFTKGIGGNGGAGFALTANSISIKGTISAIGGLGSFQYACSGGGAGGGLLLSANDITLDTIGKILMVGGEGGSNPGVGMSGGGGGGGRVKFLAQQVVNKYGLVNVKGGKGGVGSGETEHGVKGEEGSYYEAIVDRKEPIVVVSEGLTPSLALKASKPKICVGQELKFTAIAGNGGDAPTFQWKLNGADVAGATTFTYSGTDFKDGDKVSCTMQSNAACASAQTMANSDTFTINVLALADANFTTNYPYGAPGITITFTSATKGANTKRVWDFGDGFIAYDDEVIEHSFELEGIYTIKHLVNNGACVDTFSQDFLVKPLDSFVINGINNKQGESKLSVFPNPSKGHLFIAFKGASGEAISASINDLSGKQVHAITWINQINSPKKIDFDGFAKGIYIVKVNDGKQVYVQKLFLD